MSNDDAKALALQVLQKLAGAPTKDAAPSPPAVIPNAEPVATTLVDAAALIELYFDASDPLERDVIFDRLEALDAPLCAAFFAAMLAEDDDPYMRLAAAQSLAARGHAEALAYLDEQLAPAAGADSFASTCATLSALRGQAFYPAVEAIWRDVGRSADHRREALLAMELLDAPRTLALLRDFIDDLADIQRLPQGSLEDAMAAFGRHLYEDARPALQGLQQRVARASIPASLRRELIAFIDEGLALLHQDTP